MSTSSEAVQHSVVLPADLHARPAGRLSRAAAEFRAKVTLSVGERTVDARSVLMVMGLGATKDSEVTISADGEDAEQAVTAIARLLLSADEASPVAMP